MRVDVNIDNDKCLNPIICGTCMRVCPTAAFKTYPSEVRQKGKICDKWLLTYIPLECIGCGNCEKACQEGAIRVTIT